MNTHLAQTAPADPVGKFLVLYEPMKPRNLLHVEHAVHEVTGLKGKKQLLLKLAYVPEGATPTPRTFTVVGEHNAAWFCTLEAAKGFLATVASVAVQYAAIESAAWGSLAGNPPPVVAPTTARTRSRPIVSPVAPAGAAITSRVRQRGN